MTKISNFLRELNFDELNELIEKAQDKINVLEAEKQIKLIGVYNGFVAYKFFELTDKEKVIAYAHEMLERQWMDEKEKSRLDCNISIDTRFVPESDVKKFLCIGEVRND